MPGMRPICCSPRRAEGPICPPKCGHEGPCARHLAWKPGQSKAAKTGRTRRPNGLAISNMERMHGINVALWWAETWRSQDGKCYLCGEELTQNPRESHIDHDYSCCPQNRSCGN